MKSEQFTVQHELAGHLSTYRQVEVAHFREFCTALRACQQAKNETGRRFYVVNDCGQEYYEGTWID